MQKTFYTRLKGMLKEQSLKRMMLLVLVSVFGYYSMFNASGPGLNGSGVTGAPFNSGTTCTNCHSSSTNFAPTVSLQLMSGSTVITNYTAGQAYTVRITRSANAAHNALTNAGWGFQMVCATGTSNTNYNGWGTMPSGTHNSLLSGRNYVEHGSKLSKTVTTLDIPWTAPTSGSAGTATFYIALNTVDGNGNSTGDQVVNTSLSIPSVSCPTPTVSIAASSTSICSGGNVTFTATPTNGGTTPTYQWKNNGTVITGATNATYSATTIANGNVISCVMTPAAPCNVSSATSNTITMTVTPSVAPSVSITASTNSICFGTSVTFTATPTNGGATPVYQWRKNGSAITGANGATYTSTTLYNNDVISVLMTTSVACYTSQTATSNNITMAVTPTVTPSVIASASSANICAGTNVTFTATATNGGTAPTYQWRKNSTNITGATNNTYSSSSLATGDVISVAMGSSLTCVTTPSANSNNVTMTVNTSLTPSVTVSTASTTVCPSVPVVFNSSITNGGSAPQYQWMLNGSNITGATTSSYTASSGVSNGSQYAVSITSNANCLTTPTASSNTITMSLNSGVANIIVTAGSPALCTGGSVTLTADTGVAYSWSNGAGTQSINVNAAGFYTVAVTKPGGCVANSAPKRVIMFPKKNKVAAVGLTSVCQPGTVSFVTDASMGNVGLFNFQWNNNGLPIVGATDSVYTATGVSSGSITLTISGATCSSTSAAGKTFAVKPRPVASFTPLGPDTLEICAKSTLTLTAPSLPNVMYKWLLNGASKGGANPLLAKLPGEYTVIASIGSCSDTSKFPINLVVNPIPVVEGIVANASSICAGGSSVLSATPSDGAFYWWYIGATVVDSSASANKSVSPLASSTYKVMMKDSNGCYSKTGGSAKVTVNAIPAPVITPSAALISSTGTVKLNASPAAGVTFQWFSKVGNNLIPINGATSKSYIATSAGKYVVAVTKMGCAGYSLPAVLTPSGNRDEETHVTNNSNIDFELSAYPNPFGEQLNVGISGIESVNATLSVMDINGRLVMTKEMNQLNTTLDMTDMTYGVYFIRYKDNEGRTATLKVTKELSSIR